MDDLIFHPPAVSQRNQWYRFFSAGLVHADVTHLAFNMISLYLFGRFVEQAFLGLFAEKGKLLFLAMYILALPVSLLPTYFKNRHNYHYYGLGASGAVSAVVFAGLLLAPTIRVGFFFFLLLSPVMFLHHCMLSYLWYSPEKEATISITLLISGGCCRSPLCNTGHVVAEWRKRHHQLPAHDLGRSGIISNSSISFYTSYIILLYNRKIISTVFVTFLNIPIFIAPLIPHP